MKTNQILFLSIIFIFSSCITIETTSTGFKDEIYYTAEDYTEVAEKVEQDQQYLEDDQVQELDNDEENYYDEYSYDDYYDYGYSVRLRRFHGPSFGFGYYNNYYTNSFWYSGHPAHCGLSIYYGYNFWSPSYYAYYYHNPYFYSSFYPYHYYHHNNGFYAYNHYPTYYNSFDSNSIYYGPRENNKNKTPETFANRYLSQVKNRAPKYISKDNNINKKPLNKLQYSNVLNDKNSKISNKVNNNFDNNTNQNFSISKNPNFSKPLKKPSNNPNKVKPSNNNSKPIYSKPIKQKKPESYNKPSSTKRYSKPSNNYSPRNFPSRGGSNNSGRRPR